MPSSLATVLSLTSGFSPCPPVSVLVRAAYALPEAFPGSRHHVLRYFPKISLTCHALAFWLPDLPGNQPLRFALNPLRGSHYPSPSLLRSIYGCRNLSPAFPSTTPFGLALGPDLPRADEPSPGILGLSVCRILTYISLLTPAFSLLYNPPLLTVRLLLVYNAPLPL